MTGLIDDDTTVALQFPGGDFVLYIPDPASNSCWKVHCHLEDDSSLDECVEDAQLGLKRFSVSEFVENLKGIWCE